MKEARFTIVTVVLNNLHGLQRTRSSIEKQTYKGWHHLIIDGKSDDNTIFFLQNLPSENTTWISEGDSGIYDAMNKSIDFVPALNYVIFLNAEDEFANENSLQIAAHNLEAKNFPDWGCTTHEEFDPENQTWLCKLVSSPSLENQLYALGYRSHQAVVMKRELIEKHGRFDLHYKIAADWDLIVKCIKDSEPAIWNDPLARFQLGGFSSGRTLEAHRELRILRKIYLERSFLAYFYDVLWSAIYSPYRKKHDFENLFELVVIKLVQNLKKNNQQKLTYANRDLRFLIVRHAHRFLKRLFVPIEISDFKVKPSRLNKFNWFREIKLRFYSLQIPKINLGMRLSPSYIFIKWLHKKIGIKPFP